MPEPCEVCVEEEKAKPLPKPGSPAYVAAQKIYLAGKAAGMECGRSGDVAWIGMEKASEIVQEAIDESVEEPCEWYQEAKNQAFALAEKASAIQEENQRLREALENVESLIKQGRIYSASEDVTKALKGIK